MHEALVQGLSRGDHDRARRVWLRWPLHSALEAYRAAVRAEEKAQYQYDMLMWTLRRTVGGAQERQPDAPGWMRRVVARG